MCVITYSHRYISQYPIHTPTLLLLHLHLITHHQTHHNGHPSSGRVPVWPHPPLYHPTPTRQISLVFSQIEHIFKILEIKTNTTNTHNLYIHTQPLPCYHSSPDWNSGLLSISSLYISHYPN